MTPTELYRHWDAEGRLLYVGISRDAYRRLAQHYKTAPWADRIARITIEQHPTRGAAVDAEARAILDEQPQFNRAGKRRPISHICGDASTEMAKLEHYLAAHPVSRAA